MPIRGTRRWPTVGMAVAAFRLKGTKMGTRFVERLLNGMRRFLAVLGAYRRRRTTPPGPGRDAYTDQW